MKYGTLRMARLTLRIQEKGLKACSAIVLTAASVCLSAPGAARADVKADYRRCVGKLPASVREEGCSAVIAETSDKVRLEKAHNARGLARVDLGQYAGAVADFTETIRLDPKIAGYYDNRQNAYRQMGDLDSALSDAYAAVKLAPSYSFVFRSRGLVYAAMTQWPLAIDDFTRAIELDPKDGDLYVERGKARDGSGRTGQAIEDFSRALAVDPDTVEAYKQRGLAEKKLGRREEAVTDLEKYQLVHNEDVDVAAALASLRR